ncbi:hypothetical protein [Candidatus Williamhamiltonella defendens]|uniref:hypothetical protein n=1 Tax=Candidatus Williamhamiltonella defendens TaxID=138072 RepID=UPI001651120A|nr:hypothetical protein [Candidatus Hamiltonella defensa]
MSHAINFIEAPIFTHQIKQIVTAEELRELKTTLIKSTDKITFIYPVGCAK